MTIYVDIGTDLVLLQLYFNHDTRNNLYDSLFSFSIKKYPQIAAERKILKIA